MGVAYQPRTDAGAIRAASGLNALAGLWLIVAPWVLGFSADAGGGVWNAVIVGVIIAVLAAARFFGAYGAAWMSWVNALLGAWVVISPWVFGYSGNAARLWNSIIVGLLVIVLGVWSASASTPPHSPTV